MTDHFAQLHLPRRPWLEAEDLKNTFHRLAVEAHPDAATGTDAGFTALNAAHSILRDPATRLRHLLELEHPAALAAPQPIPADLAELFMEAGRCRQAFTAYAAKATAADGALARALLAADRGATVRDLDHLAAQLEVATRDTDAQLRALNARWPSADAACFADAAALHARLSYLGKWSAQTREARLQLTL